MVDAIAGKRLALRPRRARQPVDESVVDGALVLHLSGEAILAFCDLYAGVLLDALARQERGADPVSAVRESLAAAEDSRGADR